MKIHGVLIVAMLAGGMPAAMAQTTQPGASLIYSQLISPQGKRAVQKRLSKLGFHTGGTNGNWGPDSETALKEFQQSHGLQVTGELNEATVKTLNLNFQDLLDGQDTQGQETHNSSANNATGNSRVASQPINMNNLSRRTVYAVQSRLRALNFYPGQVDGVWGEDTQKALMQFQQGHALQPTGQLNPPTVSALGLNPNDIAMQGNQ